MVKFLIDAWVDQLASYPWEILKDECMRTSFRVNKTFNLLHLTGKKHS